jgi:hypothetical protein
LEESEDDEDYKGNTMRIAMMISMMSIPTMRSVKMTMNISMMRIISTMRIL